MQAIYALSLYHFRNHAYFELETGGRNVVLSGPNGAGKTNILEAVSLLSPGRGLRKSKLSQMRSYAQQHEPWVISAQGAGLQGEVQLGSALDMHSESERRLVKIDGEKASSQTALAEHLAISWHTPQMDGLFLASDGERRRYLDRLIYSFDAEHIRRVSAYEHAMRERGRLLAQGGADARWIMQLEEQMAQGSIAIAAARIELAQRLNHTIAVHESPFPQATLSVQGEAEELLQSCGDAGDAEAGMQEKIAQSRLRDAAAGRALCGAHRSCLLVRHAAKDMPAPDCSTGEQKALLLCILLAHARARKDWFGAAPILLLDETVAHLDKTRRAALAQMLESLQTQVWMSGTDVSDFDDFLPRATHVQLGG